MIFNICGCNPLEAKEVLEECIKRLSKGRKPTPREEMFWDARVHFGKNWRVFAEEHPDEAKEQEKLLVTLQYKIMEQKSNMQMLAKKSEQTFK